MKIFILLFFYSVLIFSNNKINKVNLYLKWTHSFQFAGYYAARKNGYYKAEGLEVKIIENKKFDKNRFSYILKHKNSYGVETSRILLDKKNRNKIKILAVIFQHSPLIAITLKNSDIITAQQFSNKKILGHDLSMELKAMLKKEGVNINSIKFTKRKGHGYNQLLNHEVDIVPGYITSFPYKLKNQGIEFNIINPINYGIDFYGDFLFTSNEEIENHPLRVRKFIKASLKGWNYAMAHKNEIINYILKTYPNKNTYNSLLYEANIMEEKIIMSQIIEIGHMNLFRWKHMEAVLKSLNLVNDNFNINDFIYTPEKTTIWQNKYFIYLIYTIIIITFIVLILSLFNIKLKKEVKKKIEETKDMEKRINNSQKLEAIGVLAGGIAHDFNNIISAIVSNAELAKMNTKSNNNPANELNEIISACKRAKKLVSRIISFSKGTQEDKKNVNLIFLIEGIINLTRPTIKNDSINIEFTYKNNAPINVVYTQIEQVIMNILRNAIQAIENKGKINIILDTIETRENKILFNSILPPDKYLKVTISDTGSGINKENLTKIFDPYFSTKNKKDGTGLGLFVVHGIMDKHNSYIDVQSELNKGTTFKLYFPISINDFDDIKTVTRTYQKTNNFQNYNILFIDDEEMITSSITKILTKKGFRIKSFNNPENAYEHFKKNKKTYDIIITDQNMPKITGIELVSKIRILNNKVPIILCSGYNSVVNKSNIQDYQINEYMEKPVMINELLMNISYLLSNNPR